MTLESGALEVRRLHLAALRGPDGGEWPVHGFVIIHPGGAALVDTGVGGPDDLLSDWRVVNRTAADALAGDGQTGDRDAVKRVKAEVRAERAEEFRKGRGKKR